jgi:hypothetical protein
MAWPDKWDLYELIRILVIVFIVAALPYVGVFAVIAVSSWLNFGLAETKMAALIIGLFISSLLFIWILRTPKKR